MKGLREELQRLYDTHGQLTPQVVLTAARSPKSPLHMEFDWDEKSAANSWRLEQAQRLIQRVKVKYVDRSGEETHVRAFVSLPNQEGPGRNYQPVEDVVHDEFARRLLLGDMQREWQALKRRYDRFDEFAQMILRDLGAA